MKSKEVTTDSEQQEHWRYIWIPLNGHIWQVSEPVEIDTDVLRANGLSAEAINLLIKLYKGADKKGLRKVETICKKYMFNIAEPFKELLRKKYIATRHSEKVIGDIEYLVN